jgi:hypothetical protein
MTADDPCCDIMRQQLAHRCALHPDPFDCPDNLIIRGTHGYGIAIHDGGSSYSLIRYCPWCGSELGDAK